MKFWKLIIAAILLSLVTGCTNGEVPLESGEYKPESQLDIDVPENIRLFLDFDTNIATFVDADNNTTTITIERVDSSEWEDGCQDHFSSYSQEIAYLDVESLELKGLIIEEPKLIARCPDGNKIATEGTNDGGYWQFDRISKETTK